MRAAGLVAFGLAVLAGAPAQAQIADVTVGELASTTNCSLYTNYWGDWILPICNRQFPDLKSRLGSAVSEALRASESGSGRFGGRRLVLSGRVSGISGSTTTSAGRNFCVSDQTVFATLDWAVDGMPGAGRMAGTTEKSVPVGFNMATGRGAGNEACDAGAASLAAFDRLQTELARAAARAIVQSINPMRVTEIDEEGRIRLNYGAPVLRMGMMVSVGGERALPSRYEVVTAGNGFAWAEPYSERARADIGSTATTIESDSDEANARRTRSRSLP